MPRAMTDSESGASLLEMAFLVALFLVVVMIGVAQVGSEASDSFCRTGVALKEGQETYLYDIIEHAYVNRDHPLGPQCCWPLLGHFGGGEICESDL